MKTNTTTENLRALDGVTYTGSEDGEKVHLEQDGGRIEIWFPNLPMVTEGLERTLLYHDVCNIAGGLTIEAYKGGYGGMYIDITQTASSDGQFPQGRTTITIPAASIVNHIGIIRGFYKRWMWGQ